MTQLERADAIRVRFKAMYPELVRLRDELDVVLREAQVLPADGGQSDQTISEVQFSQLRKIWESTNRLLMTLLFDTRTL